MSWTEANAPICTSCASTPVVSSSKARLERAKRDWQEGRFPKVPGEVEFIPLPEE